MATGRAGGYELEEILTRKASWLVGEFGQEFQAEAVSDTIPYDGGDTGFAQRHEFDFGEVSGIEMRARAQRHPTFAHFQSKTRNDHF